MTKQLKLRALIVAMAASTAAFANGVIPWADWIGEPNNEYNRYTTSSSPDSSPKSGTGEIIVTGANFAKDDTPECWKNGFNKDANLTLGNNCAHPYAEQVPVQPEFIVEVVSLSANVLFGFDKSTLHDEALDKLDDLARRLADSKVQTTRVIGHTDFKASDVYNRTLSERRAQAVANYLVSKGVPASKISAVGMGKSEARMTESC